MKAQGCVAEELLQLSRAVLPLYSPRSSTRSPVSPHPRPGLCSSLLGPHDHSGGRSKMNWSPLVSVSSMCFFLSRASLVFEKVCWFVDSGCVFFLSYSLLSHSDAGFCSCSPFMQRAVICEFPIYKEPFYFTQF